MYFIRSRKRFFFDIKVVNGEYYGIVDKLGFFYDDLVLYNLLVYIRRFFKSYSVDYIIQGLLLTFDNVVEKNVESLISQLFLFKNNKKEEKVYLFFENDVVKLVVKVVDRDEFFSVKIGLRF